MSLLLLIDGYNVVAPVAPPGRNPDPHWLQRERMRLLNRLAKHIDQKRRRRTCIVFDATDPPPDRPSQFEIESMDVRFAVGYPEADDLLEELIAAHSAPKSLAVVSSDHRVQAAANRRGCVAFDSQPWLDRLLESNVQLAVEQDSEAGQGSATQKPSIDDDDVESWMREFGF